MPAQGVNGIALGAVALGGLFIWAGVKGYSIPQATQNLIQGKQPSAGQTETGLVTAPTVPISGAEAITPGSIPGSASAAALKAYAQSLLILHGWPGQWASFNSIVMGESGWNPHITNGQSGAYGIAQALGHGTAATQGTEANEYGNYGTSDAVCKQANSGNGAAQLVWMCNYIKSRYGSPDAAWAFHQANNSY